MKVLNHTRLLLAFFLILCIVESSFAMQKGKPEKYSVKINTGFVNAEPYKYENKIVQARYKPQVGISVNYELIRNLDAGLYMAYSNIGHMLSYDIEVVDNRVVSESAEVVPSHALYYGVNFNYHLLPLLFKKSNLRIDVYPIAIGGLISRSWGEMNGTKVRIKPFFEYHVGLGVGYRITRLCGLFGEYSLGQLYNEGKSKATIGLAIKF